MAEKKPAKKSTAIGSKSGEKFSAAERKAMRERAAELKASRSREEDEAAVVAKIATMVPADRALAKRVHSIVKENAPMLAPKLWYGMPAYAKDGKVVCFFQDAKKFGSRYSTLGFSDQAKLDEGSMWPASFALTEITATEEKKIAALVKKATRP